jgi:hypothetical protein
MLVNSFGGLNTWTKGWWIYYVAPFVGAGLAALTYKYAFAEEEEEDDKEKEKEDLLAEDEAPGKVDVEEGEEVEAAKEAPQVSES